MSFRRASLFLIVAAAGCLPAACTLLTSFDGLSNGEADSGGLTESGSDGGSPEGAAEASLDAAPAPSRYATAVLADKPLLYYRFGETSGQDARDEISKATVPYPVTGITFGAPGPLVGESTTSVTTDGSGSIQIGPSAEFAGLAPFTVEIWAGPSPNGNSLGLLIDHEDWSAARRGWLFRVSKEDIGFERWNDVGDGGPPVNAIADNQVAVAGEWHHVVATFDGTTQRMYFDTVKRGTGDTSIPLSPIGIPFSVGKQNCSPCSSNAYVGRFAELAIYPKALPEERIAAHFAAAH